jgi:GAF domain-containing protein
VTREERVVQTFVELANTLVDDFDVIDFLDRLAERAVELLDCAQAGLMLADAGGALRVMASSSEATEALELLQIQNDEGPCFESYHSGEAVYSDDLQDELRRWPVFAPAAVQSGFGSVQAIPMRVHGETIGALNLFRAGSGRLAAPDLPLAQGMADIAAIALIQERSLRESRGVVSQLQGALSSRVIIEQAKGVLAEQAGVGVDAAFALLRTHARSCNRRLSDIAGDLIDGRIDTTTIAVAADVAAAAAADPDT